MQTIKHQTTASLTINASATTLFEIISDHENTADWIDEVKNVTLTTPGNPERGVGAIRKVKFVPKAWTTITEEITAFTPDMGFEYQIINGMPGLVTHLGRWTLEETDNGQTQTTWDVAFEFKKWHWFALFLPQFITAFNTVQKQALDGLATLVAQRS